MTPSTHCRASERADLKAFADRELPFRERRNVARHLRGCPACREELLAMTNLSTELRETAAPETPLAPELRAQILDQLPSPGALLDAEAVRRKKRVARKKLVLALGACAVAGVLTVNWFGSDVKSTFSAAALSSGASADMAAEPMSAGGAGSFSMGAGAVSAAKATNSFSKTTKELADETASQRAAAPNTAEAPAASVTTFDAQPDSVVPAERAVHREGSLTVAVANAETASDDTTAIIKNAGGFVAQNSLQTGAGQHRTATLDCRVPVDKFELVVSKVGALGSVRAKSLNGQDITAQVAGAGARSQSLEGELAVAQARLDKIQRAKKPNAGTVYESRAEVRTLRMQAAQARAQLETLRKYGSLASLYVSLQEGAPPLAQKSSWADSLSPTTRAAWDAFGSNARLPLQLVLWVLAYAPLWLPALLVWRKWGRKWLAE